MRRVASPVESDSRSTRAAGSADAEIGAAAPAIPVFDLQIEQEDLDAVEETLRSGWWTMGPRVEEFELRFAEHLGCRHVVATSSCTTALHLALLTAGVGPGDEVIVPSFTFVATVATVMQAGATPVFAEIVGQHDLCMDPEHAESLIGPRTKAVLPVHYGGYAASPRRLEALCAEKGLVLLEDCAHSPFSDVDGQALGTFGLSGAFSFFPNKVLGIGEGGALCTDSDEVATTARLLRSQGMTAGTMDRHAGRVTGYDVTALGFNYRMDEPRAALLTSRFGRLAGEIERRRELTRDYRARLAAVEGVTVPFRDDQIDGSSAYSMSVMLDDVERKDEVRTALHAKGVQTTTMYTGVHEFSAYRERFPDVSLPRTELASRTQFNLPLFPHLTDDQVERVVETLAEVLG
jgi:dTDP-4-amino-4,6-dideoxygalactose transaminase